LRKLVLILCTILPFFAAARAQPPQILIPEGQGWRFHAGDDPAFASPTFDDAAWLTVGLDKLDQVMQNCRVRPCWLRKQISLQQSTSPLQLMIFGTSGSMEVYENGERVGPPFQSSLLWMSNQEMVFPLHGIGIAPNTEIAIRLQARTAGFATYIDSTSAAIGDEQAIQATLTAHKGSRLGAYVFPLAIATILALAGLLLISLYRQQRGHSEYLWLGFSLIGLALSAGGFAVWAGGFLPFSVNGFIGDPAGYFATAAQLEFVYIFIGRKPGRALRLYQLLLVLTPIVVNPLMWAGHVGAQAILWIETGVNLPGVVWIVFLLILWRARGNREAGLLIIPMLFANAADLIIDLEYIIRFYVPTFDIPAIHLGLVEATYWPLSELLFLLSIGLIIFQRFNRVASEQAQAQADLESARSIQQVLIPEALPDIPNLRIESVYHPAQQVGGDFFQIIPLAEGTLIAIGDVSGKGLPAAMNVALIVGTLRTLAEQSSSPALILAGLNRRLLGRGPGFTTCLVLHILPTGEVTLANAGHLQPYLAGAELNLPNGVPLGIAPDADYAETALTLTPGQTLTLITDGVVEATNPTTRGLFGFDRTLAISHLPAHEIASTAQTFGQEDDIAVLTIAFQPV
jgi:hypothetical protein